MSHDPDVAGVARVDRPGEGDAIEWMGSTIRLPVLSAETDGRLSAQLATLPPGGGNPPHCHSREDELFLVRDGSLTIRCGHETLTLGPGDAALAPAGRPHTIRNGGDSPTRLLVVLTPGRLEAAFREASGQAREAFAAAFGPMGVTMLDDFDPAFTHPDVTAPAEPTVARAGEVLTARTLAGELRVAPLRLGSAALPAAAARAVLVDRGHVECEGLRAEADDVLVLPGGPHTLVGDAHVIDVSLA